MGRAAPVNDTTMKPSTQAGPGDTLLKAFFFSLIPSPLLPLVQLSTCAAVCLSSVPLLLLLCSCCC